MKKQAEPYCTFSDHSTFDHTRYLLLGALHQYLGYRHVFVSLVLPTLQRTFWPLRRKIQPLGPFTVLTHIIWYAEE
jgi:hypothetical protein